jgi:hypothetical protein
MYADLLRVLPPLHGICVDTVPRMPPHVGVYSKMLLMPADFFLDPGWWRLPVTDYHFEHVIQLPLFFLNS